MQGGYICPRCCFKSQSGDFECPYCHRIMTARGFKLHLRSKTGCVHRPSNVEACLGPPKPFKGVRKVPRAPPKHFTRRPCLQYGDSPLSTTEIEELGHELPLESEEEPPLPPIPEELTEEEETLRLFHDSLVDGLRALFNIRNLEISQDDFVSMFLPIGMESIQFGNWESASRFFIEGVKAKFEYINKPVIEEFEFALANAIHAAGLFDVPSHYLEDLEQSEFLGPL